MFKKHLEFFTMDLSSGWEVPEEYPQGIEQKILAGSLDEKLRKGSRTRLPRVKPGAFTTVLFQHDYWEKYSKFRVC